MGKSSSLFRKYQGEIKQLFDWPGMTKTLLASREVDSNRYLYLDTIFSMMPSCRKHPPKETYEYEDCPSCQGNGNSRNGKESCQQCGGLGSREEYEDEQYWLALEAIAKGHGLWVARGEDDPNCVYVGLDLVLVEEN